LVFFYSEFRGGYDRRRVEAGLTEISVGGRMLRALIPALSPEEKVIHRPRMFGCDADFSRTTFETNN